MRRGRTTKSLSWGITLLFLGTGYIFSLCNLGYASSPLVSNETPANASLHVSVYLSELSVLLSDDDGDKLTYIVETSPDFIAGRQAGSQRDVGGHGPARTRVLCPSARRG